MTELPGHEAWSEYRHQLHTDFVIFTFLSCYFQGQTEPSPVAVSMLCLDMYWIYNKNICLAMSSLVKLVITVCLLACVNVRFNFHKL